MIQLTEKGRELLNEPNPDPIFTEAELGVIKITHDHQPLNRNILIRLMMDEFWYTRQKALNAIERAMDHWVVTDSE